MAAKRKVVFKFDERSLETVDELMARTNTTAADYVEVAVIQDGQRRTLLIPKEPGNFNRREHREMNANESNIIIKEHSIETYAKGPEPTEASKAAAAKEADRMLPNGAVEIHRQTTVHSRVIITITETRVYQRVGQITIGSDMSL